MKALFQHGLLGSIAGRIAGGTDEIMRNILAERVLGLPGDVRVDKDVPLQGHSDRLELKPPEMGRRERPLRGPFLLPKCHPFVPSGLAHSVKLYRGMNGWMSYAVGGQLSVPRYKLLRNSLGTNGSSRTVFLPSPIRLPRVGTRAHRHKQARARGLLPATAGHRGRPTEHLGPATWPGPWPMTCPACNPP
jgi:hypothetical protein